MNIKNDHKESLLNLVTILDTVISSNRRRSLEPILVLLDHYINQYHASDTKISVSTEKHGYVLEEKDYSIFSKKLNDIKIGFNTTQPTAHLIFKIRDLIEQLAHHTPYVTLENTRKDHIKDDPREAFKLYLSNNDGRYTKTKEFIVDEVFKQKGHFEVESFIDGLRAKSKTISRATVYRIIKQLLEARLLQKINTRSGKVYYEESRPQNEHAHIICNQCGKIHEIKDESIRNLISTYCDKLNFKLEYQSIHIYGECLKTEDCQQ